MSEGAGNVTRKALAFLRGRLQEKELGTNPEFHQIAKKKAFGPEVAEVAAWCQTHQDPKHQPRTLKEAVAFVKAHGHRAETLRAWLVKTGQAELDTLSPSELARILGQLTARDVDLVAQKSLEPAARAYAEACRVLEEQVHKARFAEADAARHLADEQAAWLKGLEKALTHSEVDPAVAKAFMEKKSKLLPDLFKRGHGKDVVAAAQAIKPRLTRYLAMASQSPGSVMKMAVDAKMLDLVNQMRLQRLNLADEILEQLQKWIAAKEKHNAELKHQSEKLPIGRQLKAQLTADRDRWKGLVLQPPQPAHKPAKGTPGVDMVNF